VGHHIIEYCGVLQMDNNTTLGVLVGNRRFFPDHLVQAGREEILRRLEGLGFGTVALTPDDTPLGSVESLEDAKKCAALFKESADAIDGVLVTLANFGDERAVAETLRRAGLDVPVLVHAFPDDPEKMLLGDRRDSFCGKMSVCNNLVQYGTKFSLTSAHTVAPSSDDFATDLEWFGAVCRVVKGLRGARLGAIGARVAPFKTVRFSEKILEAYGISVEVIDLGDILGQVGRLDDAAQEVQERVAEVREYVLIKDVPDHALIKMAKLSLVIDEWLGENEVDAFAFQCWTAIEEYLGIVPCAVLSMFSNKLIPAACEVDITGALGMYAMMLASGKPSAILDWNNNYGDDPDKCVVFHCSNLPKDVFAEVCMSRQDILASTVGADNAWGACVGRIKPGPVTYVRVSTDDLSGVVTAYLGEGEITDDPLETFGGYGVVHVPNLQMLLRYICENGFEHHVAVNQSQVADAVYEAMDNYLEWDVYYHQ